MKGVGIGTRVNFATLSATCIALRQRAFTLIELLAVIAIIAILAAMLLPALSKASLQAKRVQRLGKLKQKLLSTQLYADHYNDIMPSTGWSSRTLYGH